MKFIGRFVESYSGIHARCEFCLHGVGVVLRPSIFLVLLLSAGAGMQASTVNCSNGPGDASAIQAAVNAGGTVTISGTCAIGSANIGISNAVSINGTATLNGSNSSIFSVASNNVSVSGLTFNGTTAVHVFGQAGSVNQYFNFSNNTVQNTNGNDGLDLDPIMQYATINNNTFYYVAPSGFANYIFDGSCYASNACDMPGTGIGGLAGWDNSTIQFNSFDLIANDGIHISWDAISQDRFYFLTSNVSVSYNTFKRVHRIALETQGVTNYVQCTGYGTPANCSDLSHIYSSNFKVAGNYAHDFFQTYVNTYAYSLVTVNDQQFVNNSGIADNPNVVANSSLAYAQETSGHLSLSQGNVYAADYFAAQTPHGWSSVFTLGGTGGGANPLATIQNNYVCTDQVASVGYSQESSTNPYPSVIQYNFNANTCPNTGHLTISSIAPAFISTSTSNGSETFNFGVISVLSVRNVQFFIDDSSAPFATQEISDLSTTFGTDARWLYHAAVNLASLSAGTHTLKALVTDVAGATQAVIQTFSNGSVGSPAAQLKPSSLSYASQAVGVASPAQLVVLTNSGTAPLTIGGISLSGSNAADFTQSSNCGSSLPAGSSCSINVIFTPSKTGSESALLSVTDNAAGSAQSVSLSGTGAAPIIQSPTPTTTLPTNLPTGMILWLANNAGVVTTGQGVNTWNDQSGNGNNALQPQAANRPLLVSGNNGQQALRFDGASSYMSIASVPINGLTGMTVFIVSSCIGDVPAGYGANSLLNWPETASWGQTFFATYQSFSEFRFGTTQTGNEKNLTLPFTRTNSFGLNEWVHSGTTDSMLLNGQAIGTWTGELQTLNGIGNAVILGRNGSTFYGGDVSEVIVYNRALSTLDRQTVEQYLMTKYHL